MTTCAVLMSVHKGADADALRRAIKSISAQECPYPVRLYLAADGELDSAHEEVVSSLKDCIFKTIRLPRNVGLAAALNVLIENLGNEEFVFRMDADDISLPGRFASQVDFLEKNPAVGIVGSDIVELDSKTGSRRIRSYPRHHDAIVAALIKRSPLAHPAVCFRRPALDALERYPAQRYCQDLAMWFRAAQIGIRFANLPATLLEFNASGVAGRRSASYARDELKTYLSGAKMLGFPIYLYVYPFARYMFRLLPSSVITWVYTNRQKRLLRPLGNSCPGRSS